MTPSPASTPDAPVSPAQLAAATGEADGAPLYIALKDPFGDMTHVFDVSAARNFYGPGAGYHVFVGKDSTLGLASSSLDPAKISGDISGLTQSQKDTHVQWYQKYSSKYPIVGHLAHDKKDE